MPLFTITLLAWIPLTVLSLYKYRGEIPDDFFVTFRYALNLAEGHGFVYNSGERVLGLSNPGFGLLLAGLHYLTGTEISLLASWVSGLFLLGAVSLLLREGLHRGHRLESLLGGTLVLGASYIWICLGGAASLVLLLLMAAAGLSARMPGWAGGLAGLAVWCRPDAVVGVVILGLLRWWEGRKPPWTYALTALLVVGLGALWAYLYYGTPLPITLESKLLLAELNGNNRGGIGFWSAAAPIWKRHGGTLAWEIAAAGLVGQYYLLRYGHHASRLLSLYGLGLAVAYPLLGVPYFTWYTVPTVISLLYGAAFFAVRSGRALGRWIGEDPEGGPWIGRCQDGPRIGFAVSVILTTLMLFTFGERSRHFIEHHSWPQRMVLYRKAAEWIRENSEPTADISALEIGAVGYFSRRPLEDLLGLVTPRALPFLHEKDLQGVFRDKPTTFLLRYNQAGRLHGLFRSHWFRRNYRVVQTFTDPSEKHVLLLYRRKAPRSPNLASPSTSSPDEGS